MTEAPARPRAWSAELDDMYDAIGAALADAERREREADEEPAPPAAGKARRLAGRFDERVKKLAARVADAERSAEAVGAELAAAETDLRGWADQLVRLRERLAAV